MRGRSSPSRRLGNLCQSPPVCRIFPRSSAARPLAGHPRISPPNAGPHQAKSQKAARTCRKWATLVGPDADLCKGTIASLYPSRTSKGRRKTRRARRIYCHHRRVISRSRMDSAKFRPIRLPRAQVLTCMAIAFVVSFGVTREITSRSFSSPSPPD